MRAAFISALIDIAERDERIVLLTGDLGYHVLEPYAARFPTRFINVGVAEQNMVGIATGMAETGFVPFVYSIATFMSMRPYEFIRNGPVLHALPVRMVGVGGGFDYGSLGPSHHALEDVGAMRMLRGLTVIVPADHRQAAASLRATWDVPGPVYYRLGKDERSLVEGLDGRFRLARTETVREGRDVLFLALGSAALEVQRAAELLAERGASATVLVVASVVPPPLGDLAAELRRHRVAITVEEHATNGALGSLVAEVVAEGGISTRLLRRGVSRAWDGYTGSDAYMRKAHGLSADALADAAVGVLGAAT